MYVSHNQYAYMAQRPPPPAKQHPGSHRTSSAYSSQAHPGEDWTQVSDPANRRRIQNRLAQRKYRQKKQTSAPASKSNSSSNSNSRRIQQSSKAPKPMIQSQFAPPMHHDGEYLFPPSYDERERSHTPPIFTPCSSHPPLPEDMLMPPYGTVSNSYRPISGGSYPEYLPVTTMPLALPPMAHPSDTLKRDPGFTGTDDSFPYLGYSPYIPGVDMSAGAPSPHTPPSLSHSYDHSARCSDLGSNTYPTTPLSMPGSPGMGQQHDPNMGAHDLNMGP